MNNSNQQKKEISIDADTLKQILDDLKELGKVR